MLPEPDRVRLRHMLDAAEKAVEFCGGKARADLEDENQPLVHALVRLIAVIGEAANQVTPATRSLLPELPWPDLVGMRNRVIHAYFDVDVAILWATVQFDLPELIQAVSALLRERAVDDPSLKKSELS